MVKTIICDGEWEIRINNSNVLAMSNGITLLSMN